MKPLQEYQLTLCYELVFRLSTNCDDLQKLPVTYRGTSCRYEYYNLSWGDMPGRKPLRKLSSTVSSHCSMASEIGLLNF